MNEQQDGSGRSIQEYLDDIRSIREAMLKGEGRLHVPAWFFFALGAIVAAGTLTHVIAWRVADIERVTALLLIWLPAFLLAGVAEVAAWVERGRREGIPWLSRSFGRFLATITGTMTAVTVLAVVALIEGVPAAGVLLLLTAIVFLGYSPFSPGAALWIGWILIGPGAGVLIAGVSGPWLTAAAGFIAAASLVAAGIAERVVARRTHG